MQAQFIHRVGNGVVKPWFKGNGKIRPIKGDPENPPYIDHDPKEYISAGTVECFPLYSLLAAINVTTVDYLSLDVEGVEYKILKSIPFDKLTIKVNQYQ